jgi:Ti-type conjugative transfer relaxase TraA
VAAYRFSAQVLSRGKGHSAVAAAAYRSGTVLPDERLGLVRDFGRRSGVAHTEILVPANSPPWASDRAQLWNRAEAMEVRRRAQVAREVQLSIPHELSAPARIALVIGFVREAFVKLGMAADIAIHKPDRLADRRNHHAHVLLPTRVLGSNGFAATKERSWNAREQLVAWRALWAEHCNRALELALAPVRVSHLSYAALGVNREPEPKMGAIATEMERRGRESLAGEDRRRVQERNRERERLRGLAREAARGLDEGSREAGEGEKGAGEQAGDLASARDLVHSSGTKGDDGVGENGVGNAGGRGRDRDRDTLLEERYGRWIADMATASGWKSRRAFLTGDIVLERQRDGVTSKIIDRGPTMTAALGNEAEVEMILTMAEGKGWKTLEFTGSEEFKELAMRRAIERGFAIDAQGKDAELVERLRRVAEPRTGRAEDVERAKAGANGQPRRDPEFVVDSALNDVTYSKSTFTMRDLDRELVAKAKSAFEREATPGELAALRQMAQQHPELLIVSQRSGEPRFSTTAVRDAERRMFEDAVALRDAAGYKTEPRVVAESAKQRTLNDEQSRALEHITSESHAAAVIGYAGTGKSHMLGAAREAWEAAGYKVYGAALAGIAAEGLESGSGIQSATIASRLGQWRGDAGQEPREPLEPGSVIVVDEAGMVGSRAMGDLVRIAQDAKAKIVLIGDYEQLQSIEAGAAFRGIVERIGAAEIKTPRRQNEEWMRAATIEMAEGKTREALARYEQAGMVHELGDLGEAKAALIDRWQSDRAANPGSSQMVLTYKVADVRDLNERARALRVAAGELGPDIKTTVMARGRPEERNFATGDRLYFLENDKSLGVRNGTLGTIKEIEATENGPRFTVDISDGKDAKNPKLVKFGIGDYAAIDHGYAATVHKSQGVTVDRAYVLAVSGFDRHLTYVAQSRHRVDSQLYWSHDQFRDRQQLDRVLSRMARNDNALDYEKGDRTPSERTPTFFRTLHQAARDFDEWVRASAHLEKIAPPDQKGIAERAHRSVVAWRADLAAKLDELRAAGIAAFPVVRSDGGSGYRARLDRARLDRLVESVDERVREQREVAQRVDRKRADEPERPISAIDARALSVVSERLLESRDYADVTVGLVGLTGRKPSEILHGSRFEVDKDRPGRVLFSRDGDRVGVSIPVNGDPQKIVNAYARLREQRDFSALDAKQLRARTGALVTASIRRTFGHDARVDDVRGMYAAAAYERERPDTSNLRYYAQTLGYSIADDKAARAFGKYTAAPVERGSAEYQRGLRDVQAALREQMAKTPIEADRAALIDKIRDLEEPKVTQGPRATIVMDARVAQQLVAERVAELALREDSVREVMDQSWPKEMPQPPEARTKQALGVARESVREAGSLQPSEQERVRVLQDRIREGERGSDVGKIDRARRAIDGIYEDRDRREREAMTRYATLEAKLAEPAMREQMRAEYESARIPFRELFAQQEARRAEIDQLRGERERLLTTESQLGTILEFEHEAPVPLVVAEDARLAFDGIAGRVETLGAEIGNRDRGSEMGVAPDEREIAVEAPKVGSL